MEIQREVLLGVIKLVLPAMARKEMFEQSNKLAFVQGKIAAFDDSVLITHPMPGGLDLEGAVDGRRLADLLGKLKAELVDLVVDNDKLLLRAGRSRAAFVVLPMALPIDSVDASGKPVDLPDGFVDQLKWVKSSCAKDASRPALNCVVVDGGWVQASDSYRASRVRHGEANLPRLMLPLAQVDVLVDYQIARVALSDGGEWARFETADGTTLSTRSLAYKFPDITPYFAVEGREVELSPALAQTIGRAAIFARREHKTDEEVRIAMRSNQVAVSAECDGGRFSEVVRCEGAVDGVEFSIHPEHLSRALEFGTRCVVGERSVLFSGEDWSHVVALRVK